MKNGTTGRSKKERTAKMKKICYLKLKKKKEPSDMLNIVLDSRDNK